MVSQATDGPIGFELEVSGPAFAGVMYRVRAEEGSGFLAVRDLALTAVVVTSQGRPMRCVDVGVGSPAPDITSWRSLLVFASSIKDAGDSLVCWRKLFVCENAMVRFYSVDCPTPEPTLPADWMSLVRLGLGVDALDETALRGRMSSSLGIRERLRLIEPIPTVLAELSAVEAAVAARLREGAALVDLLSMAHRFGADQVATVLRAFYTLAQLGLVRRADAVADPEPSSLPTSSSLTQLEFVLADHSARPGGVALGSIFATKTEGAEAKSAALVLDHAPVEPRRNAPIAAGVAQPAARVQGRTLRHFLRVAAAVLIAAAVWLAWMVAF